MDQDSKPASDNKLTTLITVTGHRPEALRLCLQWMKRQTYQGPVEWIIVQDDEEPPVIGPGRLREDWDIKIVPSSVKWQPGYNTQRTNLIDALKRISKDAEYVLFIEDDDFYRANYLEEMIKLLQTRDIVGESNSKYYMVDLPGYREMGNQWHSSLCQTGIRRKLLPEFEQALHSGEKYIDIVLWEKARAKIGTLAYLMKEKNLCIGIKGMPGRPGIGAGHRVEGYSRDPNLVKLKEWLGEDAAIYAPFIKQRAVVPDKEFIKKEKERVRRSLLPEKIILAESKQNVQPKLHATIRGSAKANGNVKGVVSRSGISAKGSYPK